MAANINLGVGIQDNTKQGLDSAYNNVTRFTSKMAEQLIMEVNLKFPNIAEQVKNFKKEISNANRSIGQFEFGGDRYDKLGRKIGSVIFDEKLLKGNLSQDTINAILPKLKDIRAGLANGSIKSLDMMSIGTDKEIKRMDTLISRLTKVRDTYDIVMRTASKRNTELTSEAAKANGSLEKQSGLLKRLGSLAARYFSIQQIVQFGRKIAETTGYFQKQQVALEGILQSATDARKVLNDISNFALQSPFRTDELVRFTKQLSAFGIDTADLFPTVKQLADISAGLGVDMDRIILAYGQVKSAAVLRGQELRQFTEAGIPMVEELAKRFTALNGELVTTSDVFDLISKRQVPFEMVAKVMADMTAEGGRFYKMQENITETMHGQMEKLKDIWTLSLNNIGKSNDGFFMGIIKGLQVIAKNVK